MQNLRLTPKFCMRKKEQGWTHSESYHLEVINFDIPHISEHSNGEQIVLDKKIEQKYVTAATRYVGISVLLTFSSPSSSEGSYRSAHTKTKQNTMHLLHLCHF
jgi:hypothetical protein